MLLKRKKNKTLMEERERLASENKKLWAKQEELQMCIKQIKESAERQATENDVAQKMRSTIYAVLDKMEPTNGIYTFGSHYNAKDVMTLVAAYVAYTKHTK